MHSSTSNAQDRAARAIERAAQSLERSALWHLSRRALSTAELRRALARKVKRLAAEEQEVPPGAVDVVVEKMARLGFLNDAVVAESASRRWQESGASHRKVREKLRRRGLSAPASRDDDAELAAARVYVRKKRLREKEREKALASLGRQGFSFDVARRALREDAD